jgi:hypothetical protein
VQGWPDSIPSKLRWGRGWDSLSCEELSRLGELVETGECRLVLSSTWRKDLECLESVGARETLAKRAKQRVKQVNKRAKQKKKKAWDEKERKEKEEKERRWAMDVVS